MKKESPLCPSDLKAFRALKNLTQEELADALGCETNTVSQWEGSNRKIPYLVGKYILETGGFSLEQLRAYNVSPTHENKKTTRSPAQKPLMTINAFKKCLEELMVSTHEKEQAEVKPNDVRFIDLFAGVGGIRRAFEDAGAKCVFSSEIDVNAQYTYYANYGVVPYGDIKKIIAEEVPDHEILCAGFPCQPFSFIGRREGFKHPTQGTMFHEIVRILEVKRPNVIFLENVPGLVNHDDGKTLKVIMETLSDLGYDCKYEILNSKDFGVPQSRARFYLVGVQRKHGGDKEFKFPEPPKVTADIKDYLETNVSGYSISHHLQKSYLFKKDDGRPILIDKTTTGPVKTLCACYHKIQRLTGTFVKDGETGVRLLTANECKAIMGFPDDFVIPVSRTQMYRQMGNSVVVKVIQAISKRVMETYFPDGRHC